MSKRGLLVCGVFVVVVNIVVFCVRWQSPTTQTKREQNKNKKKTQIISKSELFHIFFVLWVGTSIAKKKENHISFGRRRGETVETTTTPN